MRFISSAQHDGANPRVKTGIRTILWQHAKVNAASFQDLEQQALPLPYAGHSGRRPGAGVEDGMDGVQQFGGGVGLLQKGQLFFGNGMPA